MLPLSGHQKDKYIKDVLSQKKTKGITASLGNEPIKFIPRRGKKQLNIFLIETITNT